MRQTTDCCAALLLALKKYVLIIYHEKKSGQLFFLFSGCVHQYLCLVPQDRKYCNALTSVIMFESARWVTDFSALKAARAFEAIEKYAANLINQPWRKEFKEIKVSLVYYKSQFKCRESQCLNKKILKNMQQNL